MLIRLSEEIVTKHWDEISQHIRYSMSPNLHYGEVEMTRIQESILNGISQVWLMGEAREEGFIPYGMAVTTINYEYVTNAKNLLIYSVSGYQIVPQEMWRDAMQKIHEYAKGLGCQMIVAYTQVEAMRKLAESLGARQATFLSWEV